MRIQKTIGRTSRFEKKKEQKWQNYKKNIIKLLTNISKQNKNRF